LEERASVASQNGRLILTRHQANRSSYHNPPISTEGCSFTAYEQSTTTHSKALELLQHPPG
ncbi:MAG: hypothetical protein ACLQU4_09445, partial [Limisphaerales bacterium]